MKLEEIRAKVAELFPLATRFGITNPGMRQPGMERTALSPREFAEIVGKSQN